MKLHTGDHCSDPRQKKHPYGDFQQKPKENPSETREDAPQIGGDLLDIFRTLSILYVLKRNEESLLIAKKYP